jgi:hypothetical protein
MIPGLALPETTARLGVMRRYRLREGGGTTAIDAISPANNGTISGSPATGNSSRGYQIVFDGSNDLVTCPRIQWTTSTPLSLVARIQTSLAGVSQTILSNCWLSSASTYAFVFYIRSNGHLALYQSSVFPNTDVIEGATNIADGNTHSVGASVASGANPFTTLYVDGKIDATKTLTITAGNRHTAGYSLLLGQCNNTSSSNYTQKFTGVIDDIIIASALWSDNDFAAYHRGKI